MKANRWLSKEYVGVGDKLKETVENKLLTIRFKVWKDVPFSQQRTAHIDG